MKKYESYVLNFAIREDVPFTNNLAERDIRPWKMKLKVSGCFRTLEGAKKYARAKGFCHTTGHFANIIDLVAVVADTVPPATTATLATAK